MLEEVRDDEHTRQSEIPSTRPGQPAAGFVFLASSRILSERFQRTKLTKSLHVMPPDFDPLFGETVLENQTAKNHVDHIHPGPS
ncbi:MAG: hypothetical protein H7839_22175 [Magnetococcus sp. YQC-5]